MKYGHMMEEREEEEGEEEEEEKEVEEAEAEVEEGVEDKVSTVIWSSYVG